MRLTRRLKTSPGAATAAGSVKLPIPYSLPGLLLTIGGQTGRSIELARVSALPRTTALAAVVAGSSSDFIFVRDDIFGPHREHVICHELGHIVCGHLQEIPVAPVTLAGGAARHMLLRSCALGDQRESEAEDFAMLLMQRIAGVGSANPNVSDSNARVVAGLSDVLA
jgi:hypothetical protein